jgi:hypothetical protein
VYPIFASIIPFGVLTLGTQLARFGFADLSNAEQLLAFKEQVDGLQQAYNTVKYSMLRVYVLLCCIDWSAHVVAVTCSHPTVRCCAFHHLSILNPTRSLLPSRVRSATARCCFRAD